MRCTVVLANYGGNTLKSVVVDGVDAGCKIDQLWPWQSVNCTATRYTKLLLTMGLCKNVTLHLICNKAAMHVDHQMRAPAMQSYAIVPWYALSITTVCLTAMHLLTHKV